MSTRNTSLDSGRNSEGGRKAEFLDSLRSSSGAIFGSILVLVANRSLAEEVYQEVSAVLWKKYLDGDPPVNFTAWSCSIARNISRECVRRESRQRGIVSLTDAHLAQVERTHVGSFELLELRREFLRDCLDKLNSRDQAMLWGYYGASNSVPSLARRLGMTTGSLYARLRRIRIRLLECVDRKVGQK